MKTYLDLDFNRAVDVILQECEISTMEALAEYKKEFALAGLDSVIMEKKEQEIVKENSLKKVLTKIGNAILSLVNSFFEALSKIKVKKRENISPEDFKKSQLAANQINKEVERINGEIDDEILKRRKVIQLLAKGTKVPDKKIAECIDTKVMEAKIKAHKAKMTAICAAPVVVLIGGSVLKERIAEAAYDHFEKDHNLAQQTLIDAERLAHAKQQEKLNNSDAVALFNSIKKLMGFKTQNVRNAMNAAGGNSGSN